MSDRKKRKSARRQGLWFGPSGPARAALRRWVDPFRDSRDPSGVTHIDLMTDESLARISPRLFGQLIEPYGTVLDAIWVGEESHIRNEQGLRLDTIEAFQELGLRLFRWPGGTFAETCRWQDGIGPRSSRPRTWNYFFGGEETNEFGTDEFLRFCELLGATPWIKLNPVTAGLGDAINWMQYCNYKGTSHWASLRRKNGHPEPYGVKYWSIGNETWDGFSPEGYAELVHQWTFYMRQVDPDARIVVSGLKHGDWNERFLRRYAGLLDDSFLAKKNMIHVLSLKYATEEHLARAAKLLDKYLGPNTVNIAVEEWSAQSDPHIRPPGWQDLTVHEQVLRQGRSNLTYEGTVKMDAAVYAAVMLHGYMRNSHRVELATFMYPTNAWGALVRTDGAHLLRSANYYVFDLLKEHMGADRISTESDGPPGLDVVASIAKDRRKLTVSLINWKEDKTIEVRLRIRGSDASFPSLTRASVLQGKPTDENTLEQPDTVIPRPARVERRRNELNIGCEPFSLTVVTLA